MAVSADMEIVGIKDALRELNQIDKVARREITKDYKKIVQSVVDDAKARVPLAPPLKGWRRNWTTKSGAQILPWDLSDNDNITAGVSGKRPKMFAGYMQNVGVFFVKYKGATSLLFDQSGSGPTPTPQGARMAAALTRKFGSPSRVLWPAYEQNKDEVEKEVKLLVDRVMDYVNQGLAGAKERAAARSQAKLKKAA